MISFPCPCGNHKFSVPDDEAGGLIQCPRCKRLNDVPSLSDLRAMDADGTVLLAEDTRRHEPNRLAELQRAYGRGRADDNGNEIDLRQTFDQLRNVGEKPIDLAKKKKDPPKYDPITGELVREIDVAPTKPRPAIAIPQHAQATPPADPRVLGYRGGRPAAKGKKTADIPSLMSLPGRLFEPINLLVMFFVGIIFFFFCALSVPVIGGFFLVCPVPIGTFGLLLAHYSNCIQDLGPGAEEELPTPMRYAGILEDIWWPLTWTFFSLMLCFGPAFLTFWYAFGPIRFVGSGALAFAGALLFPAVYLTTSASNHVGNIRPDRLLTFIGMLGAAYLPAVIITTVALVANMLAVILFVIAFGAGLLSSKMVYMASFGGAAIGVSIFAIYMSHLAVWWLAVLYRRHEHDLPWHFEEHERNRAEHKRLKTLAEIERARNRRFAGI